MRKPERPYKDLSDARKRICFYGEKDRLCDLAFYPCIECDARGGVRDIKDLDPIEGYKMAPLYACKACGGSGAIPKKAFVAYYRGVMGKWKAEMDEYRQHKAKVKLAGSKLTKEELELLKRDALSD